MESIGIVCEYNPFHNGHLYHINKIKELYPDSTIILVMSGNFTQRGIASITDKWTKTKIALLYGVDLVVELPFVFATQGSDVFAHGSISILKELKVDMLVFGSEENDLAKLIKLANMQLENKDYDNLVKSYLKDGINYPTAISKALHKLTNTTITSPNDLLGISYIKEIIKAGSSIKPISIKRTNDYHSLDLNNNIVSASAIRKALLNNLDISNYVPSLAYDYIKNSSITNNDYYKLFQYKVLSELKDIKKYQTVDEGLENRIIKYILVSNTLEEFINNVKTKRYTYNKLMRMYIHILCNFTKAEAKDAKDISYIRLLGMTNTGRKYLNSIKKNINIPIITSIAAINDKCLDIEYRSTCIYASLLENPDKSQLIMKEYSKKPIILDNEKSK